jgi:hypothetical protein
MIMSSVVVQSRASACSYNQKASISVGWGGKIPEGAVSAYPGFSADPSSNDFALAVEAFQEHTYGAGALVDGKMGRGTWTALLKKFDRVDDTQPFWTINDRRVNVDVESPVEIVNFDQPGGLDLHRFGHFSSRKNIKPTFIVVHWGGLDPHHCHRIFSSPDREVSSHAGIGLSPEGVPTIYQYLDLNHKSWHGGWANTYSVGIDICQQPSLKWKDHSVKKGYTISEMDNDTGRGDSRVLTLDPNVALAVREAVKSLCKVLDIPYQFPCGADGQSYSGSYYHGVVDKDYLSNSFTGVIGHHHITQKKWDCACWWETLFGAK